MTLGTRIFRFVAVMLIMLAGTAGVGIWAAGSLGRDVDQALSQYDRLWMIYDLGLPVSAARAELLTGPSDRSQVRRTLLSVRQRMAQRVGDDAGDASSSRTAEAGSAEPVPRVDLDITPLDAALNAIDREQIGEAVRQLSMLRNALARRAHDTRQAIAAAQNQADRTRRLTLAIVAGVCITAVIVSSLLAWRHFHRVVGPIENLKQATSSLARRDFSPPPASPADDEIAQLNQSFSAMAQQLESLYRDLQQQVETKSRQLVQSQRLASVGHLASGFAHEINNPLAIIAGQAELAQRQLRTLRQAHQRMAQNNPSFRASHDRTDLETDELDQALAAIHDEAFRSKRIIERLLTLARPHRMGHDLFDLASLTEQTAGHLRELPKYQPRQLRTLIDPKARPAPVKGNSDEIRQVLLNVLINALEATDPSTGRVTLELSAEAQPAQAARPFDPPQPASSQSPDAFTCDPSQPADSDAAQPPPSKPAKGSTPKASKRSGSIEPRAEPAGWQLRVCDNGAGMSPQVIDQIFEPFFTQRHGNSARGLGLGLSITHAIVQEHQGTITASSPGPGRGSTMIITLPAAQADQTDDPDHPELDPGKPGRETNPREQP